MDLGEVLTAFRLAKAVASALKEAGPASTQFLRHPSTLVDLATRAPAVWQALVQELRDAGLSEHLIARAEQIAERKLPETALVQNWNDLCFGIQPYFSPSDQGQTQGAFKLRDPASPNDQSQVQRTFKFRDPDTQELKELAANVTRFTCPNSPDMGEIRFQLSNGTTKTVKSFHLEDDWAEVQRERKSSAQVDPLSCPPSQAFQLADILESVFGELVVPEATLEFVGTRSLDQLQQAARAALEAFLTRSQPALRLERVLVAELSPSPFRQQIDAVRRQVHDALCSFGTTHARAHQLAANVALFCEEQPSAEPGSGSNSNLVDKLSSLRDIFATIARLESYDRNRHLWSQLDLMIDRLLSVCNQPDSDPVCTQVDLDAAANNLDMIGRLLAQLRAGSERADRADRADPVNRGDRGDDQPARVLVALKSADFAMLFDDAVHVFNLCTDSPVGHAFIGSARCLQMLTPKTLTAVQCTAHAGLCFRNSAPMLARCVSQFDFPALLTRVDLEPKARRPLGTFAAHVRVSEVRSGDELLSTPDADGFVTVDRLVLDPRVIISMTDQNGTTFVFQDKESK